ncbi:MAG: L-glutamine:2-deoxy-scyllo-inosose aminotransferase [candidate division TA06 bacterium ADurb.Bin131]|uniref:L-glutamine:2-deoxy-scyllo-inosose aminotransferase n=1 Tax=candidate division TA06 bacterium ADurb.Bin131 TaxID=1852827 RepID=A0A1V6CBI2_UNCT6|nr:MAG: L-glutamine:2-deoxy-scyllo-inosose aminotransferase [candidate division TA06 bacterium ADurb.Bin131]
MTEEKLAINGGKRLIPEGFIKPWPPIDEIDRKYVLDSLNQTNHAFGPNCKEFEKEFAAWNGNKFSITTNSGTAALHMAVAACDCGAGDQVIVPAYTWSSSATCVLHHNCIPVFVDIDFDTMNMDTKKIEAAITEKTKAIIVVHLHGMAVNMDEVLLIAKKYNLKVIEDCCQAHGALFKGKKVGLWGDCAAFSFNQNKCLCSGEGGMFVTDNEEMYKKALMVWSFGETQTPSEKRDYHAYALGWMYRNNDLTAAFGRAQLTKLDRYLEIQEQNAGVLTKELKGTKGLIIPFVPENHKHNWYNYTIRLVPEEFGWKGKPNIFRNAVMKAIQAEGAKISVWQNFILPYMTVFQAKNAYGKGCPWSCPNSKSVSYNPEHYPVAQRHTDTHFGMTEPLRAPNGPDVADMVGKAIKKVLNNIGSLDIEKLGSIN